MIAIVPITPRQFTLIVITTESFVGHWTELFMLCIRLCATYQKQEWDQSSGRCMTIKNFGHHDFQIDLGIDLMKYGISLDWDGKLKARPSFMPKHSLIPCECNKCFFC